MRYPFLDTMLAHPVYWLVISAVLFIAGLGIIEHERSARIRRRRAQIFGRVVEFPVSPKTMDARLTRPRRRAGE